MRLKTRPTQFNCFSPPVMLATLTIEFTLAAYTVWRYKMTPLTRLITAMLVFLAVFQMAEYFVCTGSAGHVSQWSRLGFVAITTLPALGLHTMHVLADKPRRRAVALSYASMAGFMAYFLSSPTAFVGHQCTGNYVIFQLGPKVGGTYALAYYYLWLAVGIVLGAKWANEFIHQKRARIKLETVRGLIIGYLVFLVPTAVANTVSPGARAAIPSVMCGFAVLMALILVLYILPRAAEPKAELHPKDA